MSIRLNYQEDFSEGLKRLMIEECETALENIEKADDEESRHEAVHEVRKAFKKVRACLRLVRDEIDYYSEENKWFRDQGRIISDIRDATADIEALAELKEQYESELYKNSFKDLREGLLTYRKELADQIFREENRLNEIRNDLLEKVEKIPSWNLDIQSFEEIRPSIERTYGRGLNGLQESIKEGKIEHFHEWRKRVKYLRYQIDILNRLWPQVFKTLEDELHDVTDLTGFLHDMHNLQNSARRLDDPFSDEEERILFYALSDKQQEYLKKHALLKGQKFYIDSPSDFCDRFEVYWNMHQKEIQNEQLPDTEYLEYS
ncbi:MAG: CHAD domain-containing protein [Balneolaceae bacterium]|nr:CHAD domain-containing protein [Balneolaceae bacterium]